MINSIQGLSNIHEVFNNNQCKCSSNSGAFDMMMASLLNAIATKNKVTSNESLINLDTLKAQNLIQNSNKIEVSSKNIDIKNQIESSVKIASKKYRVDENLIKSIIKVEYNFNPNTVSSSGAKGLMQLMPENIKDLGVKNPFDINENIDVGTRHIKEYIDRHNGYIEMALMAYNGGPTRMMKRGVTSINDIYKIPKETQNYVPKVMKYYKK